MALFTTDDPQAGQTLAVRIRRVYAEGFESAIFYNKQLFGLFAVGPSDGDTAFRGKYKTRGNLSARRKPAEGAAPPVSSEGVLINYDLDYETFDGRFEITGEMIAALRGMGSFYNVVEDEMQDLQDAIRDQIVNRMIGAVGPGMQNAVADAGVYAGVDRALQANWRSLVTPGVGALTKTALDNHWLAATDPERKMNIDAHVTSGTQIRNYNQLPAGGGVVAANSAPQRLIVTDGKAPSIDIGSMWSGSQFNGKPILQLDDLPATIWFMLDRTKWRYVRHEAFNVRVLGPVDDGTDIYVWERGVLTCRDPFHQSTMTGIA